MHFLYNNIKQRNMSDMGVRLKTEGAVLNRNNELNLEKYGQLLKNQLEQISKFLTKKKAPPKQDDSPVLNFKKNLKASYEIESARNHQKNVKKELEESICRKSKEREQENKRHRIYATESCMEQEEAIYKRNILSKKEQKESVDQKQQLDRVQKVKSPFSDTMSTAASHRKPKQKLQKITGMGISDFTLGKKLGQGKFGQVFVAQHRQTGFICAIKRIYRCNLDQKMLMQLVRQIKIQSYLNHPNIVKLYNFFADEKSIYLVQQLCYSGQLYGYLKKNRKVSEELTRIIIQQICRALDYMHECQIIHRDLKPENIIYHNGLVKICDFGWSISSKKMRQTFCGTPIYVSPELLKRKSYNNKIDVWGLGVLAYELLFGRVPFQIVSEKDFIKIIEDQIKFSKSMSISQQAKDFISICLQKDPRQRYTVPELLEHPFISRIENPILGELY